MTDLKTERDVVTGFARRTLAETVARRLIRG